MRRTDRVRLRGSRLVIGIAVAALVLPVTAASAQTADPREGLTPGFQDAEQASENMDLLAHLDKPAGFFDPNNPGNFGFANSDMAFSDDHAFVGNYAGFLIYDVSDPDDPALRTAVACPGGQGDISVSGDLAFVSVQERGTEDCTDLEAGDQPFVGVRVFDISDLDSPEQVAAVDTCRGSHTHTVVEDPDDAGNVYVYVSGTSGVRDDAPAGLDCEVGPTVTEDGEEVPSNDPDDFDENTETDRFQIEVIQVPVAAPGLADVVAEPRVFAVDGNPFGLGSGEGRARATDSCHDITAYAEIGLAAGACEGNGILFDITDPMAPERIDFVADENFAYWHSATFNNDGTKVVFTDELGGGVGATCLPDLDEDEDLEESELGANAIFDLVEGDDGGLEFEFASYYKIPPVQTDTENCVAHNGSLVPVPGRDILVQAWYQGGISVMDFTDSENPEEIAFFDRGPLDEDQLILGGFWSAYYYNGHIYGSEIARGFDVLELTESEHLSADELEQAAAVRLDDFNPQAQPQITDADRDVCAQVALVDFSDVTVGEHVDQIGCIGGFGITDGTGGGAYSPNENVVRGQMATFVARMLRTAGVEFDADSEDAFPDDDNSVHADAIDQLAALEVVQGMDDGTFAPNGNVSRAQMASFVVRAVEEVLGEQLPAPRSDFDDIAGGHATAIDKAAAAGITEGFDDTTYGPNEQITRAQMASFITRSLDVLRLDGVELTALEN
jgi:hypothetical protein